MASKSKKQLITEGTYDIEKVEVNNSWLGKYAIITTTDGKKYYTSPMSVLLDFLKPGVKGTVVIEPTEKMFNGRPVPRARYAEPILKQESVNATKNIKATINENDAQVIQKRDNSISINNPSKTQVNPTEQLRSTQEGLLHTMGKKDENGSSSNKGSNRENNSSLKIEPPVDNAPKVELNYANMSARDIATAYENEMAKIIISGGETITKGLFEDAGAEFEANAAARNASILMKKHAEQWTGDNVDRIAEILSDAVESSESPLECAKVLTENNVDHAEVIARTEMARVREEANLDIMRAQGFERVQYVASEDERLCPECGRYNGKVFDVRDAPVLPIHPNCRCTLVPYIEEV